MLEDSTEAVGDTLESSVLDKSDMSESSGSHEQSLKRYLRETYGRRPMELVNRYCRSLSDLAAYANNSILLLRCRTMRIVPKAYRVDCREIKNTRNVMRILDECSYRLMLADLDYNRLRKVQVTRLLECLHEKLEKIMSAEDMSSIVDLSRGNYENIFEETRDKQRNMFAELLEEYEMDHENDQENEE